MTLDLDSPSDDGVVVTGRAVGSNWEMALQEAGISRDAEYETVAWRREVELVATPAVDRDGVDAEQVEVHGGVLDAHPLVLVLVFLARGEHGDVRASLVTGRPVAHSRGPLVGPHGILPEADFERVTETFVDGVAAHARE